MQQLPPYKFIDTQSAWEQCLQDWSKETQLAIDLEANGMFAYRERICLMQLSTREQDYIIDPCAGFRFDGFDAILEDERIEKIFHAAEYDMILIKREYGWKMNNLFDTMWAARILGHHKVGLASMMQDKFEITLEKKYQRSNWCQRPLKREQLAYAQGDTHYLFRLRDVLGRELYQKEHLDEAAEIFEEQTRVRLPDTDFNSQSFWSIKGVNKLSRQQQGVVRALAIYRDDQARKRDVPVFKVFSNKSIIAVSQDMPRNFNQLRNVDGMTEGLVRRFGKQMIRLIQLGRANPPQRPPRAPRTPDAIMNRFETLRNWRKNKAIARGVISDVILNRHTLWEIAETNPQTLADFENMETIGPWRRAHYSEELLDLLKSTQNRKR